MGDIVVESSSRWQEQASGILTIYFSCAFYAVKASEI